ncbi:MAG: DUF3305 domain-containing protein [Casimicrobiaceae bacterium]
MTPLYFFVDVDIKRVPLANRWASEQWLPSAVVPLGAVKNEANSEEALKSAGAPQRIADDALATTWRFSGFAIELHTTEAQGYFLNISSDVPKVFVMWRLVEEPQHDRCAARPVIVTVSYDQAARFMDGGERVDAVPMPAAILAWMRPFVAEHYRPEPRKKVRRNDPFAKDALGRDRPPRA